MKEFIKQLISDLKKGKHYRIARFYPYTSVVQYRIVEMNPNFKTDLDQDLTELYATINSILLRRGVTPDNKTAVMIVSTPDTDETYWHREAGSFFVGRYDGMVSIGFGVFTEKGDQKYIKEL